MRTKGTIVVAVSLAVADTGPGIPDADLGRIFDPFERLGAEQTAIEGTGIGLPLARAFAEAMKGHLTVASIPGEGPTFTVTLPRTPDLVPAANDTVRATGVIAYLTKPLELTELGQLLDSFAAGHAHQADPVPRTVPAP